MQAFQNFSRNLRIHLKIIIMGTSPQFHDGVQLKFYPHLAQRYYTLLDWIQETFSKAWSSLVLLWTIMETLMCNSSCSVKLTSHIVIWLNLELHITEIIHKSMADLPSPSVPRGCRLIRYLILIGYLVNSS